MQITPSVDSAMFFFGTNALHFSEEFYGTVLLIDGIAQVIGKFKNLCYSSSGQEWQQTVLPSLCIQNMQPLWRSPSQ